MSSKRLGDVFPQTLSRLLYSIETSMFPFIFRSNVLTPKGISIQPAFRFPLFTLPVVAIV
jgi:hypothetical protein